MKSIYYFSHDTNAHSDERKFLIKNFIEVKKKWQDRLKQG